MENIKATVKGNVLLLEVPLCNPPRPSSSGKTLLVATTGGNVTLDLQIGGKPVKLGLNAYVAKG